VIPPQRYLDASSRDVTTPVAFFANGIGDTLMALPALRALAATFEGRMTLICHGLGAEMLTELPLRDVVMLEMWAYGSTREFDVSRIASRVSGCELFMSLPAWTSNSLLACLATLRPRRSIGFSSHFDIALRPDASRHLVDEFFAIPQLIGGRLNVDDFAYPARLPPDAVAAAARLRRMVGPAKLLAVHTETWHAKMWSDAAWIEAVDTFLDVHPEYVAIVIDQHERKLPDARHRGHLIPAFGLPLPIAAALVMEADLFAGVDSCMLHVADLAGVPAVGIFGPTSSRRYGFRFTNPHRHVCGNARMRDISPIEVAQALVACAELRQPDGGRERRPLPGDATMRRAPAAVKKRLSGVLSALRMPTCPESPGSRLAQSLDQWPHRRNRESARAELRVLVACSRPDGIVASEFRRLLETVTDWGYTMKTAQAHGILPLLYHRLQSTESDHVPDAVAWQLRAHSHANALRNVVLRRVLHEILERFESRDIDVMLWRGPGSLAGTAAAITCAEFTHIELLVRQESLADARQVLLGSGYTSLRQASGTAYANQSDDGTEWVAREGNGVAAVLRSRIFLGAEQHRTEPLSFDHAWERATRTSVAGVRFMNPSPEDRLMFLCVHGSAQSWCQLHDLAVTAAFISDHPGLQWSGFGDDSPSLEVRRIVHLGMRLSNELLGVALPPDVRRDICSDSEVASAAARATRQIYGGDMVPGSPS
jgi:ADP-heptose:LPS heptosyltransferase